MTDGLKYEIVITADENDGDYVTEISVVDAETIGKIMPVIEAIRKFNESGEAVESGYSVTNWANGHEQRYLAKHPTILYPELTKEQIYAFNRLVPNGDESYGVHTIISVEYYPIPTKVKLL